MSRQIHICRKTSTTLPVDAMTGITWYCEGWSPPEAYRRAVDLPDPTSPVMTDMAPRLTA